MVRVSLIPLSPGHSTSSGDRLASFRLKLEQAGYAVLIDPRDAALIVPDPPSRLVARAVGRIRAASGTYLLVVDLAMAYTPDDVLAVVQRLETGPASLVVATRRGRWFADIKRRVTGTSDLRSGLVGMTQEAARRADAAFAPIGSRFACELLARVDGERTEVEVEPFESPAHRWAPLDDIRHAKRVADHKFGNLSRLLQFCFVGASGMVVDLSTYAALQAILSRTWLDSHALYRAGSAGVPVSIAVGVAAVLAIATAMTWNFSLNRRLTFNDARRGSIIRQYGRYTLSNLIGCGVSLAFRLLLPGSIPFFARHRLAAAVAGIVAATGISFTLARWFVFGVRSAQTNVDPALPVEDGFHETAAKLGSDRTLVTTSRR